MPTDGGGREGGDEQRADILTARRPTPNKKKTRTQNPSFLFVLSVSARGGEY